MNLKSRVNKLEQKTGGGVHWRMFRQNLDNPELFTDGVTGEVLTQDEAKAKWPNCNFTWIIYVDDWRGVNDK